MIKRCLSLRPSVLLRVSSWLALLVRGCVFAALQNIRVSLLGRTYFLVLYSRTNYVEYFLFYLALISRANGVEYDVVSNERSRRSCDDGLCPSVSLAREKAAAGTMVCSLQISGIVDS